MSEQNNGAGGIDHEAEERDYQRHIGDFYWARKQPEFWDRYRGQVVVFYKREVLGAGPGYLEAAEAAEAALLAAGRPRPPRNELVFVYYQRKCDVEIWDTPDYSSIGDEARTAKEG